MEKDRRELENYLLRKCEKIALVSEHNEFLASFLKEKYNIPESLTNDMVTRRLISIQEDFELFCLLDGIGTLYKDKEILRIYFTEQEINAYVLMQYEEENFKFPIKVECLQVKENQWMGCVDTNFFMWLRKAQKIHYNPKTQRVMTKRVKGGEEHLEITLHEANVKGIQKCLKEGKYIPTPITLNIPLESEAKFEYDNDEKQLIIYSLTAFDIIDGYHRYVAMSREKAINPEFNYMWEIRIVNFSEAQARFFVYQENQKTQMKKTVAKIMDSYNSGNIVTTRLNNDISCNLYNQIDDITGKMSASHFAICVDYFYFSSSEEAKTSDYIKVQNELREKINRITQEEVELLDKKFSYGELVVLIFTFKNTTNLDILTKCTLYMLENMKKINPVKLSTGRKITKGLLKELNNLLEEAKVYDV